MTVIKFSHGYNKMPRDFERSKLLEVLPVKLQDLSLDFVLYDTSYLDGGEEKMYPLPAKGDYMILLLMSACGQLWSTIRRQTPEKEKYYRSHIGDVLECRITR